MGRLPKQGKPPLRRWVSLTEVLKPCLKREKSRVKSLERVGFARSSFESIWVAICLAYPKACWNPLLGQPIGRWKSAHDGLLTLANWLLTLSVCRGEAFMAKAIKDELAKIRASALLVEGYSRIPFLERYFRGSLCTSGWIGESKTRLLFQLSRAGRALPRGNKELAKKAMKDHENNLTSSFT
jgi:hypothetical protein